MRSKKDIQIALFKRMKVLVNNDRALFELEMEPETPQDHVLIQSMVDDYLKRADMVLADIVLSLSSLRECRTDIPRPRDV